MADATTIGVRGAEPAETTRHDGTDLTLAIQLAEQRAAALRGCEQCAHRARVNRVEGAAEVLHRGQRATRVLGQYLPVDERIRVSLKDSRFNAQEDLRGALRCVVDKHYHGKPRKMAMANAVTRRECTNETWMTMGSRRRTSAATAACGRYLASKVKLVCTASLGTPVVPEVCVMSAGSWGWG